MPRTWLKLIKTALLPFLFCGGTLMHAQFFTPAVGSPFPVGTVSGAVSVMTGDFNHDGKLDLVTTNGNSNTVSIFLGNGAGGFTQASGSPIAVGTDPIFSVVGDFNSDGNLDLAVANYRSNNVTILLGNGTGSFSPASGSPIAAGANPGSLAVGDLNGDGKLDLVVTNQTNHSATVLLGNGTGAFAAAPGSPFQTGSIPLSVAIGDFNGDRIPDLAIANFNDGNITVLIGNGSGGFAQASSSPFAVGLFPTSVSIADFNGDGNLDLATANNGNNNVTVLLGNGAASFTQAPGSPFPAGSGSYSVAAGDLNGDGKPDLAISDVGSSNVTVLLGSGTGSFAAAPGSPYLAGSDPQSVIMGDFNRDGRLDLAVANNVSNSVTVLLNTAPASIQTRIGFYYNGTFVLDASGNGLYDGAPPDQYFSYIAPQAGDVAVSGDWNGDGRTKIGIYRNGYWILDYNGNGIYDYDGTPSGDRFYGFGGPTNQGYVPVVGDWNGDGKSKIGYYRNGFWLLDYNGDGIYNAGDRFFGFGGNPNEYPIVGDWNGDHRTKAGVFSNGTFVLDFNGSGGYDAGDKVYNYLSYTSADRPLVGDWNGNGITKIGIFRNGFWILDYNGDGVYQSSDKFYGFGGNAGEIPVVGDWTGTGNAKIGLYVNGFWILDANGNGSYDGTGVDQDRFAGFGGNAGEQPLLGKWQ